MDTIFIQALQVDALIGVYEWERRAPQPLRFDVELGFDLRTAGASDAVADTLDYGAICARLKQIATESQFALVEALAERCCAALLAEFPAQSVKLRLAKGRVIPDAEQVGVIIERRREGASA